MMKEKEKSLTDINVLKTAGVSSGIDEVINECTIANKHFHLYITVKHEFA